MNRAGVGLIELVSEPEISSAADAALFVQRCHEMFQDLRICSGNLEEGAMRIDVNVNLVEDGTDKLVTPRVELKNINGISVIESAINAELKRQITAIHNNITLSQETRLYSPERDETILLRAKDSSESYRYMPEYDLPPMDLSPFDTAHNFSTRQERIKLIQSKYPELPTDILLRLWSRPQILPDFFEHALKSNSTGSRFLLNWCVGEFLALLNHPEFTCTTLSTFKITPLQFALLVNNVKNGTIDKEIAKSELYTALKESRDLNFISAKSSSNLDSTVDSVNRAIDELFANNPDRVNFLKSPEGQKRGSVDFFIGPLLKQFRGRISAKGLTIILKEKLGIPT